MLLLRGPQTPGELRSRTDRMYHFEALEDITSTLDRLAQREPPLARSPPAPAWHQRIPLHAPFLRGATTFPDVAESAGVARALSPANAGANSISDRVGMLC